ncbi:MAG: hypothetical protein R3D51_03495 [Hyphomicrobiaceae bacterium]
MPAKSGDQSTRRARAARRTSPDAAAPDPSKLFEVQVRPVARGAKRRSAIKYLVGDTSKPPRSIESRSAVEEGAPLSEKVARDLIARIKRHVARLTKPARLSSRQIAGLLRELAATYEQTGQPPPLPDKAPELWSEREGRSENPVAFIRRVYAPWLGRGLIRPHVKALDPGLYNAFNVWCHRNPDDTLPELLTLSARIDEMVEDLSGRYDPEDLRKLGLALQMRHRKQK